MKSYVLIVRKSLLFVSIVLSSLSVLAQTNAGRVRVTEAVDTQKLVTLRGNVHPLARPEFDQGVAPDNLPMERMLLVLQRAPEQESTLRQLLDDQQVKSSPRFHQWLTPQQFGQQFGPADSDVQAVTDWLTAQGFQVANVSAGHTVIEFSGTAGLMRQVLGTEIHRFRANGQDHWANTSDPQIPVALTPVVAGFASLNNFPRKPMSHPLGTFRWSKATGEVQPLFTVPISGGYEFPLGPTDFATIYNVLPLWNSNIDGTGQTIAVVGETNINPQDVADFRTMFGLPPNAPNIILNGPDPGVTSDEIESDLDVQWSGAVAKGATIDLVVSESTETTAGTDLSALYIIDNNLAPILSESYGVCEAELGAGGNQFYSTLWEQAAAQGITVLLAAGDSGSAGCDSTGSGETDAKYGLGVSGFASTPFNVVVGGTDFNVGPGTVLTYWSLTNNSAKSSAVSYIPESTWNDSCAVAGLLGCTPPPNYTYLSDGTDLTAGSGGPSSCINPTGTFPSVTCSGNYPKPSWQSGTGVPNDSARDIPDVSLFAADGFNYSFYVFCQMDANASAGGSSTSCDLNAPYRDFQGGSGTSISAQAFAGIMALVNQRYGRQGNANYVLYPLAAQAGNTCVSNAAAVNTTSCIFYDVTAGNNSVICQGGTPNCTNTSPASGQYGIMVSGGSPAYAATTGYDLATGLGSVNVANLVNHWTSSFTPTTTTLSPNPANTPLPVTVTHGQPFNFTVSVAPTSGSGAPTGDVSLIAQTSNSQNVSPSTGIGPFTLNGGSVSTSTVMLPGGSYNVTAHYAGNGTLAASDSSPGIPVTVGKENSQTKISLATFDPSTGAPTVNNGTTPYGSPYVLRMDVLHTSDNNLCASLTTGLISYPCPTGGVTVSPAPTDQNLPPGSVAGSYTLNSQGYAEDWAIQQSPGGYNFVVTYAGDNSYNPITSPAVPLVITKAPTTVTLSDLPSTAIGTNVTVTITVNTQSNGVAPGGTIQFFSGGIPLGPPLALAGVPYTPSTGAYATGTVTSTYSLTPGVDTVTAQYSGDSNYAGSTSAPVAITVTDFSLSANPSTVNVSAPGQTGNSAVSIAALGGYNGTIYLSCQTAGTGMACAISPSSVIISSSSPGAGTLTVYTTATAGTAPPTLQREAPPSHGAPVEWFWISVGLLVLATVLSLTPAGRRRAGWLFAGSLLLISVWVACGGGDSGGGGSAPPRAPIVSFSPQSLTFPTQTLGSFGYGLVVYLSNTGNASLIINSITIGGTNPGDFQAGGNCSGALDPQTACAIDVTFKATATGSRTATLTISDNANNSPQSVSLTGTAVPPGPTATLSPTSLVFASYNTWATSPLQNVGLYNTGTATLNISSITLGGTNPQDFAETNNCPSGFGTSGSCIISVTFRPTAGGTRSASIVVTDNASDSPQAVPLTGTGVALPPTPPGTYSVIVSGNIGGITHQLTVPVTVQ